MPTHTSDSASLVRYLVLLRAVWGNMFSKVSRLVPNIYKLIMCKQNNANISLHAHLLRMSGAK